jgi:hypothetical protein
MQQNVHFIMTVAALVLFGIIAVKPEALQKLQNESRICNLNKGKMDCYFRHTTYRINSISEASANSN